MHGDALGVAIADLQAEVDAIVDHHRAELRAVLGRRLLQHCGDVSSSQFLLVGPTDSTGYGSSFQDGDCGAVPPGTVHDVGAAPLRNSMTPGRWGAAAARPPSPPEAEALQVLPSASDQESVRFSACAWADGGPQRKRPTASWTDGPAGGVAGEEPTLGPRRSSKISNAISGMFSAASLKTSKSRVPGASKDSAAPGRFEKSKKLRGLKTVKVDSLLFQDAREEALQQQTRLQRMTRHKFFEWFTGVLILLNAAFIGISAQYMALDGLSRSKQGLPADGTEPSLFLGIQLIFTFLFTVELLFRWVAEGFAGFFQTEDVSWNAFDVAVVGFGWVDMLSSLWPLLSSTPLMQNTSILRVMRVIRIVRVARVIRIMRFFRELRMMIVALTGSLKSMVWVFAILMMLFFMFGISLTSGVTDLMNEENGWAKEEYRNLIDSFGTLESSILTLYMAMSGGQDWGDAYATLSALSPTHRFFFMVFVSFALFAVVNIVTGIFVDTALQCNSSDKEAVVQEELAAKEKYLERMRLAFEEMDANGTGLLSMDEFQRKLDDERVQAYFNALKLDVSDASKLFMLLDYDQSGEIGIDEFLTGVHKLKGESRALDMAIMMYEVRWLAEALINLQDFCDKGFARLAPKAS